jgi:lipoprotein-releasing system permease protein
MFKFILAARYLRTRYIALASIVSVMLGVATMIVVNSVMSGFREEMYTRLHGILSDIVVESHSLEGIGDPQKIEEQIRSTLGDDLEGVTMTVHVPGMLSFRFGEEWITRQVNLIGIDDVTYAGVSDFSKFLLHADNREKLSFDLREDGYGERLQDAGWGYRRWRVRSQRLYEQHLLEIEQRKQAEAEIQAPFDVQAPLDPELVSHEHDEGVDARNCPHCGGALAEDSVPFEGMVDPTGPPGTEEFGHVFDDMVEQHTGIVLGIATSNVKKRDSAGEVQDYFLCRPGDDVQVTFPSSGTPPTPVNATFTVVDFYESKMSEYDATFAFCPLSKLQEFRGMIDREHGTAAVTSIQLKLREGASLAESRDAIRALLPISQYRYRVDSWKDMQGPLLAAVQWETTILNILLFLIIGVAGFGIFATFFMIVVEKTKDIGILKSLGASSRGVMSIFLSYGCALGTMGAGVGMVLGVLFVWYINDIATLIEWVTGQEVFDPTVYYFQEIPTILNPLTIAWIVAGAMIIALLASVLPALRAARMHPVEALRYE